VPGGLPVWTQVAAKPSVNPGRTISVGNVQASAAGPG
jgi:hypothetical protein